MKKLVLSILISLIFFSSFAQKSYKYPITPKDSIVNEYFDIQISDPYQWMENPNDPRLIEWIETQKSLTKIQSDNQTRIWDLRAQIASMYSDVKEETTDDYVELDSKLKSKYVFKEERNRDDRTPDLFFKLRKESVYHSLIKSKDFRPEKKDNVVFTSYDTNEDEDIVVIRMTVNGSDWQTAYVFDLKTRKQLSDTIKYIRAFSNFEWHGKNLYYDGYDVPEQGRELLDKAKGQKLYYHVMGTSQLQDRMLFQNRDTTGTNSFNYFRIDKRLYFYHYYTFKNEIVRALSVTDIDPDKFLLNNFLLSSTPLVSNIIKRFLF